MGCGDGSGAVRASARMRRAPCGEPPRGSSVSVRWVGPSPGCGVRGQRRRPAGGGDGPAPARSALYSAATSRHWLASPLRSDPRAPLGQRVCVRGRGPSCQTVQRGGRDRALCIELGTGTSESRRRGSQRTAYTTSPHLHRQMPNAVLHLSYGRRLRLRRSVRRSCRMMLFRRFWMRRCSAILGPPQAPAARCQLVADPPATGCNGAAPDLAGEVITYQQNGDRVSRRRGPPSSFPRGPGGVSLWVFPEMKPPPEVRNSRLRGSRAVPARATPSRITPIMAEIDKSPSSARRRTVRREGGKGGRKRLPCGFWVGDSAPPSGLAGGHISSRKCSRDRTSRFSPSAGSSRTS